MAGRAVLPWLVAVAALLLAFALALAVLAERLLTALPLVALALPGGVALAAFLAWRRARAGQQALAARAAAAEEELQLLRARAGLLATAAHEIRTPLAGILGLLDLLLTRSALPEEAHADACAARGAAADLSALLGDLLEVARMPGAAAPSSEPFRVDEAMEQVAALLRGAAAEQGTRIATAIAPGTPPAWRGNQPALRRILTNLAANAIRFTRQGEVRLEARETAAGALELRVADTGRGIATDRLPGMFERFQRSEGGTGLGLAICRELARGMGGDISVASAPGLGTAFTVTLPLPVAPPESVAPARPPASAPERARTAVPLLPEFSPVPLPLVLVVDDVAINRRVLVAELQQAGYAAVTAADGEGALAVLRQRHIAAVLMDLQLPGMGGPETTRRIRALPPPVGQVPVLAVTAHAGAEARAVAIAAGMDAVLQKPVGAASLAAALARAIARPGASTPLDPELWSTLRVTQAEPALRRLAGQALGCIAAARPELRDPTTAAAAAWAIAAACDGVGAASAAAAARALARAPGQAASLAPTLEAALTALEGALEAELPGAIGMTARQVPEGAGQWQTGSVTI
jgi:signal transduction histidine kinase/DNA-binding NarL/FixJ family response regulator